VSADIQSPYRQYPIACLAPGEQEAMPSLDELHEILGPGARVFVVVGERLLRKLPRASGTSISLGSVPVWLWWPSSLRKRLAPSGAERAAALVEFARRVDLSRPLVRSSFARLEQRLTMLSQTHDRLSTELNEALQEGLAGIHRADSLEERLRSAWELVNAITLTVGADARDLAVLPRLGLEARMHVAIFCAWMRQTHECRPTPPLLYTLGPGFIRALVDQAGFEPLRLAPSCARIASSSADADVAVRARPGLGGLVTDQAVRADGAVAWEARILDKRLAPVGGARIHYWVHRSGLVEFDSVGVRE
jgi:hypothetical protein